MSLKPTRQWRGMRESFQSPAQVMAYKENYQLFQLQGMLGHLGRLIYVDHRNKTAYESIIVQINSLINTIKARQSCRINPNQSKCEQLKEN